MVTNLFVSLPLLTKEGALNFFPIGRALKLLCFRTDFNNIACSYESNSPIVLPSSSLPSAFLKSINLLNTGGMFNLKRYTGIETVSLVHSLVFLINILQKRVVILPAHSFLKYFFIYDAPSVRGEMLSLGLFSLWCSATRFCQRNNRI